MLRDIDRSFVSGPHSGVFETIGNMQPHHVHAVASSIVACGKDGGGRQQYSLEPRSGRWRVHSAGDALANRLERGGDECGGLASDGGNSLYVAARSGAVVGDSRLHAPALLRFALDGADGALATRAAAMAHGDGVDGRFSEPSGLACCGTRVYLADKSAGSVLAFDARTLRHLYRCGRPGKGDGELDRPRAVAAHAPRNVAAHQLYVIDRGDGSGRLQHFSVSDRGECTYLRSLGGGRLPAPRAVAVGDGHLYVACRVGLCVLEMCEGTLLQTLAPPAPPRAQKGAQLDAACWLPKLGAVCAASAENNMLCVWRLERAAAAEEAEEEAAAAAAAAAAEAATGDESDEAEFAWERAPADEAPAKRQRQSDALDAFFE